MSSDTWSGFVSGFSFFSRCSSVWLFFIFSPKNHARSFAAVGTPIAICESYTEADDYFAEPSARPNDEERTRSKSVHISAAIIVLAGAILLLGGSWLIRHDDTKLFIQFVGCIVGAVGLVGWIFSSTKS